MAAAAADFTADSYSQTKLKKSGEAGLSLNLVQTTDVLSTLARARPDGQVVVGFAAETASDQTELLKLGSEKLARKGCQLLVVNNVSDGAVFGAADNEVILLGETGELGRAEGTKTSVAHVILDAAAKFWERKSA